MNVPIAQRPCQERSELICTQIMPELFRADSGITVPIAVPLPAPPVQPILGLEPVVQ